MPTLAGAPSVSPCTTLLSVALFLNSPHLPLSANKEENVGRRQARYGSLAARRVRRERTGVRRNEGGGGGGGSG